MVERLGDVLYRAACIAAVLWAIFVLVVAPALSSTWIGPYGRLLRPPVPLLFGEIGRAWPAICYYLVTDFFRGAIANTPLLPPRPTNRLTT